MSSPPPLLPSERARQKKCSFSDVESSSSSRNPNELDSMGLSSGSSSIKSGGVGGGAPTETDDEADTMLDLMYDPCLNCYFDPKTGKYYELKN